MNKKRILTALSLVWVLGLPLRLSAQHANEVTGLIKRILPKQAASFIVEPLPDVAEKDAFEIESRQGKIVLRGNNGVSQASALYYYLTEYCHCQITWNGTQLKLPTTLPAIQGVVHRTTPYEYRYYLNYCTFNYSMSWWDWSRWEKEIDWMALHGINTPLAITGEEYVWYEVYKEMGFTDEDLSAFFCGPAYFAWFWMGNLDGWGGPLPLSWMTSHRDLQKKILQRERALGMKPVLASFTGHVPASFQKYFPKAKLKKTNWTNGFADTWILDSEDPMFAKIGKKFLEAQTRLYGTDHLYSSDTFNENEPPTDDTAYLATLSARIYESMRQADTAATWVMQGWLFYSDRKFWKAPQIKALLDAVPDNHMLLLDLATEIEPVWKRTESFYGKPWIWNMLHNFGGNVSLFGRIETVAQQPALALQDGKHGKLQGIGLTMEAIEQTPVLYELMTQHIWQDSVIDVNNWLNKYIRNRYGSLNANAVAAWQVMKTTVYNGQNIRDGAESIITGRPTFDSATKWTKTRLNYKGEDLLPAWDSMIAAISQCAGSDGFQYDLVDLTRQVLANYAQPLQHQWVTAWKAKDKAAFKKYSTAFLQLISDIDTLLATRKDFLLGKWIADARACGTTAQEKALYEHNARDLITLWGDANSPLHEYSCRQWSGLLNDFYKPRWQQYFALLDSALQKGDTVNQEAFEQRIQQWEWKWVNTQKSFPVTTKGQSVAQAQRLYNKYRKVLKEVYMSSL
ncbi:alpha-N-acetylglucosaminidase [Filimonas lacunae]|uniref:Alpha-N-acetylglucosaminidase n=1 Tax=Filimonas lacunae TaxID=477680 RepID=A0A173MNW8_9BACT|nr:alpha-N-acetylglucosaminidase [Filimonas lacunae]BAV09343.1 alpha-N-acetylglucosaminidase [Filimonas lacunae]SIS71423.1 alpha-N-acetylglucosaminidase [Filimonas lacunae]